MRPAAARPLYNEVYRHEVWARGSSRDSNMLRAIGS